jgi:hypothetical protein
MVCPLTRWLAPLLVFMPMACGDATTARTAPPVLTAAEITADLDTLRGVRVYFNHQSVGASLLEAIKRLDPKFPISHLDAAALPPPGKGILETMLGSNGDPASKIRAFSEALAQISAAPEIALTKLCFVDFNENPDVDSLFAEYQRTFDALKAAHPKTRFLHVTVPLVIKKPRWKTLVKAVLGRPEDSFANSQRDAFSALLRRTYGDDAIFDLARLESTGEDGSSESFEHGGRQVPALLSAYSSDGAHLNERGADLVARQLVHTLALAARRQ